MSVYFPVEYASLSESWHKDCKILLVKTRLGELAIIVKLMLIYWPKTRSNIYCTFFNILASTQKFYNEHDFFKTLFLQMTVKLKFNFYYWQLFLHVSYYCYVKPCICNSVNAVCKNYIMHLLVQII